MKLLIAGDIHNSLRHAQYLIQVAEENEIKIIIQLGDWGFTWPRIGKWRELDESLTEADIVMMFICGNHSNYSDLKQRGIWRADHLCPMTDRITYIPRGVAFNFDGVSFMGLGGAVSIDRDRRIEGASWWSEEAITGRDIAKALEVEHVDVLLTHDCFAYETEILTRQGVRKIGDLAGQEVEVLTTGAKGPAVWVSAPINGRGVQPLLRLTLQRNGRKRIIHTTAEHRWIKNGTENSKNHNTEWVMTSELKPGDRLAKAFRKNIKTCALSPVGIMAGIVYGDGTLRGDAAHVDLYGEKRELISWFSNCPSIVLKRPNGVNFDQIRGLPRFFKTEFPSIGESRSYLGGWLAGYVATDGSVASNGQVELTSSKRESLEFVQAVATELGLGFGPISCRHNGPSSYNPGGSCYRLQLWRETFPIEMVLRSSHRENWRASTNDIQWVVVSVERTDRIEEVYCATVPETGKFVLAGNLLTGNCPFGMSVIEEYAQRVPTKYDDASVANRKAVRVVVEGLTPTHLYHGHWHLRYSETLLHNGHRTEVTGLDCDGTGEKSWTVLDTADL